MDASLETGLRGGGLRHRVIDLEAHTTPPGFAVMMLPGFANGPYGCPFSPVVLMRGVGERQRKRNKSSEAGNFLISSSGRNEMEEDRHYGL
jgi:hypothetical protein